MSLPLERLRGSIPPLITPFRDGAVDYDGYARLVELQIKHASHGVLVNGTTSEDAQTQVAYQEGPFEPRTAPGVT